MFAQILKIVNKNFIISTEKFKKGTETMDTNHATIKHLLFDLGIPANLNGHTFIIAAHQLLSDDPDKYCVDHKTLLNDLADRFHTTAKSIDKGIRYAILAGHTEKYGIIINTKKAVPSSLQFVYGLYFYLS